jgi:tetratricopeptide (TPR) repeat protein
MRQWETSARLDDSYAVVHRNLAVAWANRKSGASLEKAIASLERAVSLEHKYALHFAELDGMYEAAGAPPEKRLALLEGNRDIVAQRDDAQARLIAMKVVAGKYDEAIALLQERRFAVWEGGSLDVADAWMDAHILRGRQLLASRQASAARAEFLAARSIPENLPAERRGGAGREAEIAYWIGEAEDAAGHPSEARGLWTAAAGEAGGERRGEGERDLARGIQRYYQGVALARLGEAEKAAAIFRGLVKTGEQGRSRAARSDFFTSFGEQQNQRAGLASAWFLEGLGHRGLQDEEHARAAFDEALRVNPSHLGARAELR